ncbi:hypothetical protein ACHAP5_007062 [Fusarium lateritium]
MRPPQHPNPRRGQRRMAYNADKVPPRHIRLAKAPLRKKWRRKVLWMCGIALAPEFGVALAVQQYVNARKDLEIANKGRSKGLKQEYTMTHAFYVQMGGIVIYDVPTSITAQRSSSEGDPLMDPAASFTDPVELVHDTTSETNGPSIPQGRMITSLAELDDIEVNISEHEIKDLSKADIITKAFAIIQSGVGYPGLYPLRIHHAYVLVV